MLGLTICSRYIRRLPHWSMFYLTPMVCGSRLCVEEYREIQLCAFVREFPDIVFDELHRQGLVRDGFPTAGVAGWNKPATSLLTCGGRICHRALIVRWILAGMLPVRILAGRIHNLRRVFGDVSRFPESLDIISSVLSVFAV